MKIGVIGTGQFAGSFIGLWQLHPEVKAIYVTDLVAERAAQHAATLRASTGSWTALTRCSRPTWTRWRSFTQRWTHGQLVLERSRPASTSTRRCRWRSASTRSPQIIDAGPGDRADLHDGRDQLLQPGGRSTPGRSSPSGEFGRVFYSEGDYVHDMDLGFYAAYQYSGGESWKATASYPPMLYPTHAVGGVLGALPTHATHVSAASACPTTAATACSTSRSRQFDNDFSNMSALFELADGGVMRTNEFRRVGYPSHVRESRFRFFGTDAVMEQTSTGASWSTRTEITEIGELFETRLADRPVRARVRRTGPGPGAQLRIGVCACARPFPAARRVRRRAERTRGGAPLPG